MKNTKRFLSLVLALVMVMAMSVTAFAAGEGKITISNDQATPLKYEAYQVFSGDIEGGKLTNVEWGNGVNGDDLLTALKGDQKLGTAFVDCKTAADVAKVLETFDDSQMQAVSVIVSQNLAAKAGDSTQNGTTYTIPNLDLGYYFVQDVSGLETAEGRASKFAMIVVKDDTATIQIKTEVPSQEKKVEENQDANYSGTDVERETWGEGFNDVADYNVGDKVPFQLYSKVPNFAGQKSYYFEFMDKMDDAFTFNKDVVVYIDGQEYTGADVKIPGNTSTDGTQATFSVVFEDLVQTMDESLIGKEIRITFTAVLNENAVVGRPGNYNKSKLRYGNKPGEQGKPTPETPWDEVVVFTYELDVNKIDGETKAKLEDAKFVFYRMNGTEKEYVSTLKDGKVATWKAIDDAPANTADLTEYYQNNGAYVFSSTNGMFSVIGLDEGTYFLKETKAPEGYNLLKNDVEVVITATTGNGHNGADADKLVELNITAGGKTTPGNVQTGAVSTDIENNEGSELPETGGIGTTIFYIVGALLALGAGVVLVTRRRMMK